MENKTDYAVGRVAEDTQQFDYVRVDERRLTVYNASSFDDASKYEDLEKAKQIVQAQNMMSTIFGGNYVYKVVQRDTQFTVLDENGVKDESSNELIPTEQPAE